VLDSLPKGVAFTWDLHHRGNTTIDYFNPKTFTATCDPNKGVNVDAFPVLQ
jgi:hypothetical protein